MLTDSVCAPQGALAALRCTLIRPVLGGEAGTGWQVLGWGRWSKRLCRGVANPTSNNPALLRGGGGGVGGWKALDLLAPGWRLSSPACPQAW